jgi:hypothetical protein
MTQDEIIEMAQEKALQALHNENERLGLYRDAYGQPEQEPVAGHIGWLVRNSQGKLDLLTELQIDSSLEKYERLHKLYTTPLQRTEPVIDKSSAIRIATALGWTPQRTWVGLTDGEKSELWEISRAALPRYATYASLVEAKLKGKNCG